MAISLNSAIVRSCCSPPGSLGEVAVGSVLEPLSDPLAQKVLVVEERLFAEDLEVLFPELPNRHPGEAHDLFVGVRVHLKPPFNVLLSTPRPGDLRSFSGHQPHCGMKASAARTIKAILGNLLRFFGLCHIGREQAALNHEPPRLDVAQVAIGQDGGELRDDLPGRHQARVALLNGVPPPGSRKGGSAWASSLVSGNHSTVRTDGGRLRTYPQASLATPLGGLRSVAVPSSGGWRHTGPPVSAPAQRLSYIPEESSKRRVSTPPATWLLNKMSY